MIGYTYIGIDLISNKNYYSIGYTKNVNKRLNLYRRISPNYCFVIIIENNIYKELSKKLLNDLITFKISKQIVNRSFILIRKIVLGAGFIESKDGIYRKFINQEEYISLLKKEGIVITMHNPIDIDYNSEEEELFSDNE